MNNLNGLSRAEVNYSNFCGPTALQAATGYPLAMCTKLLAELKRARGGRVRKSTSIMDLQRAMDVLGYKTQLIPIKFNLSLRRHLCANYVNGTWTKSQVVLAGRHFYVVKDNRIVWDNGVRKMKSQVYWVLTFTST